MESPPFCESWDLGQSKKWFERFDSDKHIALAAVIDGKLAGIACSFAYRGGGVFRDTVETSVYVHHEMTGRGIGGRLYKELLDRLANQKVHRVVVGIAVPNEGSIALHKKLGFEEIGVFDEYAFHKGEYRSSLWMQKKFS